MLLRLAARALDITTGGVEAALCLAKGALGVEPVGVDRGEAGGSGG